MPAETVAALIDSVTGLWSVADDIEITLEANPTSVEAQKFRDFRKSGVNRVSIGVQALSASELAFLGREHNVDEALNALSLAHEIFPRMSFDLIYARPNQTLSLWEEELTTALKYAKDHISLYQLTIEENTAFHHIYHNGGFTLPEDNIAADMYLLTQEITEAHGLPAYEISNHSSPGGESRHNMAYWRSQDYIGIGPGAHGRYRLNPGKDVCTGTVINRLATENIKSPERWLEKVLQTGNGLATEITIERKESFEEAVMMGLRLSSGICYDDWNERIGIDLRSIIAQPAIDELRSMSLIIADRNNIKATKTGRLLLNGITKKILAY